LTLYITDSANRVPTLRTAFPHDTILTVDFPLYGRFTRTSKLKYDAWPKLKPLAKARIDKLLKIALVHHEICGVFDPTDYGCTLARDVQEALRGVNAQVSFLFPTTFDIDMIRSAKRVGLDHEPDVKYIVDRYVSQKLESLLNDSIPDIVAGLTRAQALELGILFGLSRSYRPFIREDSLHRIWSATEHASGVVQSKQKRTTVVPVAHALVNAPVSWERLWGGLERLQSLGLATTTEAPMSDEIFDRCSVELDRLGLTPANALPLQSAFWITRPSHDSRMIVDELAARPLFSWLRTETLRACCASLDAVVLQGVLGPYRYSAPLVDAWLPLDSGVVSSPKYALTEPGSVKLDERFVPLITFTDHCRKFLSERETWAALAKLVRKQFVKRTSTGIWLTSYGCMTILALRCIMPISLNPRLSELVDDVVAEPSSDGRLDMLGALFSEYVDTHEDIWEGVFQGRQLHMCSSTMSSWIASSKDESVYGLAMVDGLIQIVTPGRKLKLPCPCGHELVKISLNASYEPQLICESCHREMPLVTLKSME